MTAGPWQVYDEAKLSLVDGTIDLDEGDAFFAFCLLTNAYTIDLTDTTYADISADEVANANGYTTGGEGATNITLSHVTGTVTFDSDDVVWTAAGGSIVARNCALVHINTGAGLPQAADKLISVFLLDDTPADVTATDGADLKVQMHASGIFTLASA